MRVKNPVFGLAAILVISLLAVACGPAAANPTVAPTKPAAAPTTAPTVSSAKPAASPTTAGPAAASPTSAAAPTKPAAASPAAGAPDIAAGKTVFDTNCNGCHPGGNKGVGPEIKGKSADVVKKQVRSGGGGMPAFTASQISDAQLDSLAAYVAQLK